MIFLVSLTPSALLQILLSKVSHRCSCWFFCWCPYTFIFLTTLFVVFCLSGKFVCEKVLYDDSWIVGFTNCWIRELLENRCIWQNNPNDGGIRKKSCSSESAGNPRILRPILCDWPLVQAWVYKYDDKLQRGINIHADKAAVNFNSRLGENHSIDPDHGGGLVVFTEKPPEDLDCDT